MNLHRVTLLEPLLLRRLPLLFKGGSENILFKGGSENILFKGGSENILFKGWSEIL